MFTMLAVEEGPERRFLVQGASAMSVAQVTPIFAVVFDAFDTLCEIGDPHHPFAELARASSRQVDARTALMTRPLGIRQAAEHLDSSGIDIAELEQRLQIELASIRLFDDTIPTLTELKRRGIKLAIASNLAAPYALPLLKLLPFQLDAYAWSFEIGYLKPQAEIFEWVTSRIGVPAAATLMVGDTYKADYVGALNAGLQARHLVRPPNSPSGGTMIQSLTEILDLHLAEQA